MRGATGRWARDVLEVRVSALRRRRREQTFSAGPPGFPATHRMTTPWPNQEAASLWLVCCIGKGLTRLRLRPTRHGTGIRSSLSQKNNKTISVLSVWFLLITRSSQPPCVLRRGAPFLTHLSTSCRVKCPSSSARQWGSISPSSKVLRVPLHLRSVPCRLRRCPPRSFGRRRSRRGRGGAAP